MVLPRTSQMPNIQAMTGRFVLPLLLMMTLAAKADQFRTISGREYSKVTVSQIGPDYIIVAQGNIPTKLMLADLVPSDRAKVEQQCAAARLQHEQAAMIAAQQKRQQDAARDAIRQREAQIQRQMEEEKAKPVKLTCVDGTTYTVITVMECHQDVLRFFHQPSAPAGTFPTEVRVPYTNLPPKWASLLEWKLVNVPGLAAAKRK
jgi:hypothetical protein